MIRALFGQVGTDASANAIQLVATAAALGLEEAPALGEFRHAGNIALLVATAAGGANVVLREKRVRPERHLAVRALLVGGKTLAAMADGAAKL